MTDKLIEQIKADREAGTPGPWYHCHIYGWGIPDGEPKMVSARDHNSKSIAGDCPIAIAKAGAEHWETKWPAAVNARRLARVPDMEARILADAAVVEAAEALAEQCEVAFDNVDGGAPPAFYNALDAFRQAQARAEKGGE